MSKKLDKKVSVGLEFKSR